ncbi:MAG TPA: NADH-quinone oxidoreductase subunit H [Pirellulales bacterium]|jgi:formate hydrogenlyase subunit 4|nr:NADH-quinone oxidoreductase subunit H [Pirellulales bacterium]
MHLFNIIIHLLVAAMLPPLLRGVIIKTKAAVAGRVGAPILQPYYDIIKLMRKGSVYSTTTTWIFRAGPIVFLVTTAMAAMIIPFGEPNLADDHLTPFPFAGDVILFAYLLGLGRFFMSAAALDTGSSFEGMGTAREMTFACLAEPALFFGLLVTAKLSKSLTLTEMLGDSLQNHWGDGGASLVLVLVSWFIVLLAENSRIPFDDPNTHLELTMIHEVMVLDHSGPGLGMIFYGAAIKLLIFTALIVRILTALILRILAPPHSAVFSWLIFLALSLFVAAAIGVVESIMARLRMMENFKLLATACVLSAFGIILQTSN